MPIATSPCCRVFPPVEREAKHDVEPVTVLEVHDTLALRLATSALEDAGIATL